MQNRGNSVIRASPATTPSSPTIQPMKRLSFESIYKLKKHKSVCSELIMTGNLSGELDLPGARWHRQPQPVTPQPIRLQHEDFPTVSPVSLEFNGRLTVALTIAWECSASSSTPRDMSAKPRGTLA